MTSNGWAVAVTGSCRVQLWAVRANPEHQLLSSTGGTPALEDFPATDSDVVAQARGQDEKPLLQRVSHSVS